MSKAWFLEKHGITLYINSDSLPEGEELAIDIETDEKDNAISLAVCGDSKSVYVYFNLSERAGLLAELKNRKLIAHNGKSDIGWLEKYGFKMSDLAYDTMLAEYVLCSTSPYFGLKPLALKWLGFKWPSYKEITTGKEFIAEACEANKQLYTQKIKELKKKPSYVITKAPKRIPLYQHPIEIIANYTGWDAYACYMLKKHQEKRTNPLSKAFMEKIEFPTAHVLHEVEKLGIKMDVSKLLQVHKKFLIQARDAKKKFYKEMRGLKPLISSPSQVLDAFHKLGIYVEATNEDALLHYQGEAAVAALLEYRHASKICSTYTKPLFKKAMASPDHRIHCTFMQHTVTGRLGCRNPNLQNQPPELRECFIAEDGSTYVNADYSQIELRVPAHFSQEPLMVDTFINGKKKMHQVTADAIGKSYKVGKTVNFLLTNSGGPKRLAEVAEITIQEAEEAYNNHREQFSTFWAWVAQEIALARKQGGVYTLYGRFIPIPDLRSPDMGKRKYAERQAISCKVQGSAADMMKSAMIKLHRKYGLIPVVTVHDELMFEPLINNAQDVEQKVREVMEGIAKLRVPLVVDVGIGNTWATAKKKGLIMIKAYAAHAMTGRPGTDVVAESDQVLEVFTRYGIEVLDPVTAENVKPSKKTINASYAVLDGYWRRDKEMIREAQVLVDLTPERKSEGVSHEIGYARYYLWKKVIRVYPKGKIPSNLSVAFFEDDFVTDSLEDAAKEILRTHGTLIKRVYWRLKILNRSFLKALLHHIQEFK